MVIQLFAWPKKIAALEGASWRRHVQRNGGNSRRCEALEQGDEVISTAQLYGGTYRLMRDVFPICITVRVATSRWHRSSGHAADKSLTWKLPPIRRCAW
jgi:O-acetylhomoserine/O-acetylserine sulfhydrylase-like pyridoxal-dependent enzyme